jgi:hypothetical protein
MEDYKNTTRIIVNFFVTIFVIVVILTVLLLLLYYLTPNNYFIELFNGSKYNLVKEYMVKIKPGTNVDIPNSDSDNNFLKFYQAEIVNIPTEIVNIPIEKTKDIQLLIKNALKSQCLIYNQDELIKTRLGSKIIILNQSESEIDIKISIYN